MCTERGGKPAVSCLYIYINIYISIIEREHPFLFNFVILNQKLN
jgi:hypothetical protein